MTRPRHISWFLQAENDLRSVQHLINGNLFAQACFNAQQAAEKALKALAYFRGADMVKSHALDTIVKDLKINGQLLSYATKLDIYYLTARYPDALPDHAVPSEKFNKEMADEAYQMAEVYIKKIKEEIYK